MSSSSNDNDWWAELTKMSSAFAHLHEQRAGGGVVGRPRLASTNPYPTMGLPPTMVAGQPVHKLSPLMTRLSQQPTVTDVFIPRRLYLGSTPPPQTGTNRTTGKAELLPQSLVVRNLLDNGMALGNEKQHNDRPPSIASKVCEMSREKLSKACTLFSHKFI